MPKCHKQGCNEPGLFLIHLDDLDGSFECDACIEHAEQFKQWVQEETDRQGGTWTAVFTQIIDDTMVHATIETNGRA